jgi:hypothetical protein
LKALKRAGFTSTYATSTTTNWQTSGYYSGAVAGQSAVSPPSLPAASSPQTASAPGQIYPKPYQPSYDAQQQKADAEARREKLAADLAEMDRAANYTAEQDAKDAKVVVDLDNGTIEEVDQPQ